MNKLTPLLFLLLIAVAAYFEPKIQNFYEQKRTGKPGYSAERPAIPKRETAAAKQPANSDIKSKADDGIKNFRNSDIQLTAASAVTDIPVNGLSDLNYKTREEIYELRKKFVSKSLFSDESYYPSSSVFGQIEGNKPWIGIKAMNYRWDKATIPEGLSEESRFINNPSALVMLNMAYNNATTGKYFDEDMYLLPESITYHKNENTIKVVYSLRRFLNEVRNDYKTKALYMLDGSNARDFGFEWVFAYDTQGVSFPGSSVKDRPCMFLNFFHLGNSTGYPGGCNNGSPYQSELNFSILQLPSHIYLKLWKEQPSSTSKKPDINVDLIFL